MEILYENLLLINWQHIVMWLIGGILIFLAIKKDMEPTLLLPLGFGTILVNVPLSGAVTQTTNSVAAQSIGGAVLRASTEAEHMALAAVVIGGGLSLMASEYPDGLEWSMEQVTGTAELEADGDAYETAAAVYQKFWRSGKHSGPYTCEAGLTGTQCACQICHHAG